MQINLVSLMINYRTCRARLNGMALAMCCLVSYLDGSESWSETSLTLKTISHVEMTSMTAEALR